MATNLGHEFGGRVIENYSAFRHGAVEKSHMSEALVASAAEIRTGHPKFSKLAIGEYGTCEMASLFLDLSNFTGRTFWDDPREVTDLAHAVLSGFTGVVERLGGHVLGLRGDGLFAGFGPTVDPAVAVGVAATAAAAALDGVQSVLNPRLEEMGIERIQARAGADYGMATFVRSGTWQTNEINIIGFASNFAAKCEKAASAWGLVVGESFAEYIQAKALLTTHRDSPKRYTRSGETRSYDYFDYSWSHLLAEVDTAVDELSGRALESIGY